MELFLNKRLTSYLNEILENYPIEGSLMNFLKKEGYEIGKEFPEEKGIKSRYIYKKETIARYGLVIIKRNKLAIFLNIASENNELQIIYANKGFKLTEPFKESLSDMLRTGFNGVKGTLEIILRTTAVANIHLYEEIYKNNSRIGGSLIEDKSMERFSEKGEKELFEYALPRRAVIYARLHSPSSAVRYVFTGIRKYFIYKEGEGKRAFKSLSDKEKKRLKITLAKEVFKRTFLRYSTEYSQSKQRFYVDIRNGYRRAPVYMKEVFYALKTENIYTRYNFEENEDKEFFESFFEEYIDIVIEICSNKNEFNKLLKSTTTRYEFELPKEIKDFRRKLLKAIKVLKGKQIFVSIKESIENLPEIQDKIIKDQGKERDQYTRPENTEFNEGITNVVPIIDIDEEEIPF